MVIGMTTKTCIVKAQVSIPILLQFGILDEIGLVTRTAINTGMSPRKRVSRQLVIKGFFLEPDERKISPVMVTVARCTLLALYTRAGMISPLLSEQLADFLVTSQAFVIGNLFAKDVTLGAISDAFQMSMGLRQWSGRQLRPSRPDETKD